MDTIQVSIEAKGEEQEILVSELSELGATGFEQTEELLIAYFPELDFKSYEVQKAIGTYINHTMILKEENWNKVWERNFQPVVVDRFCAVRADFHEPIQGVMHEIIITPKMSFGTGHHATTYMMMEQMKDIDFMGKRVFDFGTGTGILAILAEKLGADKIIATDIDTWSIENAGENIQRNGCSRIRLSLSETLPVGQYDIILANINRNVILGYLSQLASILVPGGKLLLSGLMVADEEDIRKACIQSGFQLMKISERNNWISILYHHGLP
jgi:ribosomal protein L11 methyltransferase